MKPGTPLRKRSRKVPSGRVVFLLDVDNTLLDNDRVAADLRRHLTRTVGRTCERKYWKMFERLREELGYADYLGALQRYRLEHAHDPKLLSVSSYLVNYPFADRLYPKSLLAVKRYRAWGKMVTTVFPRQGHYANDPQVLRAFPSPDVTLERIDDLLDHDLPGLFAAGQGQGKPFKRKRARGFCSVCLTTN